MNAQNPIPSSGETEPIPYGQLPPYEQADWEIKNMFGIDLPKEPRLSAEREGELLERIRKAPDEERDLEAEREYLRYRVRTVYNAVKNIPESNGLTLEDYFQIGCEAVLVEARGNKLSSLEYSVPIYLNNKIKAAVRDTGRDMHFAGAGREIPEIDDLEEQADIVPYEDEEIPSSGMDPSEEVEKAEEAEILENAIRISSSTDNDIRVMELKYGLKLTEGEEERPETEPTLSSIGNELGVTKERIRQIDARILKKLAQNPNIRAIQDFETAETLRDRTPVVVTDDPYEQRIARQLGYDVCSTLIMKVLDDLETGIYYSGAPTMSRMSSRQLLRGSQEEIEKKARLVRRLAGIWGAMGIQASDDTPDPHSRSTRAIDVKQKINRRLRTPNQVWRTTRRISSDDY